MTEKWEGMISQYGAVYMEDKPEKDADIALNGQKPA